MQSTISEDLVPLIFLEIEQVITLDSNSDKDPFLFRRGFGMFRENNKEVHGELGFTPQGWLLLKTLSKSEFEIKTSKN